MKKSGIEKPEYREKIGWRAKERGIASLMLSEPDQALVNVGSGN